MPHEFLSQLKDRGPRRAARHALRQLIYKLERYVGTEESSLTKHRANLSRQISSQFNDTIHYGPFRGLKFPSSETWIPTDRAAMLLGIYEQEVVEALTTLPSTYNALINLGAGDGYYGIGALVAGMFQRSYCYETNLTRQQTLSVSAVLNNVENRIVVHGTAQKNFYDAFSDDQLSQSVIIIDIEGREFDFLDEHAFQAMRKSVLFVEIHERPRDDKTPRTNKLKLDAASTHAVTELTTTSRDLSKFPELRNLSDTDRWLLCSESRKYLMVWLRFDPL
jgi:hypothetical protein